MTVTSAGGLFYPLQRRHHLPDLTSASWPRLQRDSRDHRVIAGAGVSAQEATLRSRLTRGFLKMFPRRREPRLVRSPESTEHGACRSDGGRMSADTAEDEVIQQRKALPDFSLSAHLSLSLSLSLSLPCAAAEGRLLLL